MKVKVWELMLAGIIAAVTMGGCENKTDQNPDSIVENPDSTAKKESKASDNTLYTVDWDEVAEIEILLMDSAKGTTEEMKSRVEDGINKITEDEIRVHVSLNYVSMGSYAQQVSLMMSSGENLDLLLTAPMDAAAFNVLASNKQLLDITDLLDEYGQPVLDVVGDLIKGTTVDGTVYGVPVYRSLGSELSIYIRKDILEDLGLVEQAQAIESWDELTEIWDTILSDEKYAGMTALAPGPGPCLISKSGSYNAKDTFSDSVTYDTLGNANKLIAVLGDSDEVILNYENEQYFDMIRLMEEWDAKGYIYKDSLTAESGADLMKNNVAVSCIIDTEFGSELTAAATYGYDVVKIPVVKYPISTTSVTKFTWAVPNMSKEPEAAIAFMSMMYTDSRIANLMAWGVEGVDYEVVDSVAKYVEGNEDNAYHSSDYMVGNQFIVLPWDGQSADYRQKQMEDMEASPISKYLGFSVDTNSITNELSAVSVAINEYVPTLECGFGDEALYEAFIDKLYDSGVQKIIDEYQKQLDEWLALEAEQ